MAEQQHKRIKREFAKQASDFGKLGLTLARADYLRWMVENLPLRRNDEVLDVAAGTGHLSRAIAPRVRCVTAFDLTPEMLGEARRAAEQEGLANIAFTEGDAERLPYGDDSFDVVVTRFAVHHFEAPVAQVRQMARVCKPGGQVALIDQTSPDHPGRAASYNRIERLRDPSHVRALASAELVGLLHGAALELAHSDSREIEVNVESWLELTKTLPPTAEAIRRELDREIGGSGETGMRPFRRDGDLFFTQTWQIVVGRKHTRVT